MLSSRDGTKGQKNGKQSWNQPTQWRRRPKNGLFSSFSSFSSSVCSPGNKNRPLFFFNISKVFSVAKTWNCAQRVVCLQLPVC